MKKIAITGNIASGKSQVERILVSLGYKVVDTDKINHSILSSDLNTINLIKDEFKQDDILDEHGNISREKLGKIIFYEHAKKIKLEQILHAKIDELLINFYNENKDKEVVFVSIPLLFEAKKQNDFDKIILVSADENIRLKRLIERNSYSEEYAKTRINSQQSEKDKIKKSDFVIYNNSDFLSLQKQVLNILNQLAL